MRKNEAFPSNYLGKEDVQTPIVATCGSVAMGMIKGEHGEDNKPVMTWQEQHIKPLILNNANWATLEDAYGSDSDMWRGKPIEVYADPNVMFGTKRVGGVRLRLPTRVQTGNPSGPVVWGWADAEAAAKAAGIPREELLAYLKSQGLMSWKPDVHTALVQALILAKKNPTEEPLDFGAVEEKLPDNPFGKKAPDKYPENQEADSVHNQAPPTEVDEHAQVAPRRSKKQKAG